MVQCQPSLKSLSAACFAGFAVLLAAVPARAEVWLWAGPTIANLTTVRAGGQLGPGAQLGVGVELSESFAVVVDAAASHHPAAPESELPADRVLATSLGLRYDFDVFTYVPYGGIAGAFYLDVPAVTDAIPATNAGGKAFLGVDWRWHRNWSVGAHAELHLLLTDLNRFPVYNFFGLNLAYHIRL